MSFLPVKRAVARINRSFSFDVFLVRKHVLMITGGLALAATPSDTGSSRCTLTASPT